MNRDLIYLVSLMLLLSLSGNCFADQMESRQIVVGPAGFTVSLQEVNTPLLLLELQMLQQELWNQQIGLLTQLADLSFSAIDTIITIIVPGGLLYAFNKKLHQQQATTNLTELNGRLIQLQSDIDQLQIAQL
jgi:hypothetical protein